MEKIDWYDAEELAAIICGLGKNYDTDEVEEALAEKFSIDLEDFHKIIEALAPMARISKSELTGNIYCGFAHNGYFVVKTEVHL